MGESFLKSIHEMSDEETDECEKHLGGVAEGDEDHALDYIDEMIDELAEENGIENNLSSELNKARESLSMERERSSRLEIEYEILNREIRKLRLQLLRATKGRMEHQDTKDENVKLKEQLHKSNSELQLERETRKNLELEKEILIGKLQESRKLNTIQKQLLDIQKV